MQPPLEESVDAPFWATFVVFCCKRHGKESLTSCLPSRQRTYSRSFGETRERTVDSTASEEVGARLMLWYSCYGPLLVCHEDEGGVVKTNPWTSQHYGLEDAAPACRALPRKGVAYVSSGRCYLE